MVEVDKKLTPSLSHFSARSCRLFTMFELSNEPGDETAAVPNDDDADDDETAVC